ncbi:MAG: MFS transporter [Caulobacteraceae bacterium]
MSETPPRDAPARSGTAVYILLSVMFINMVGFGIVIPLLGFYAESFQAANWQIALIFSAYSAGSFFGEPFWGRLSDRIGRRPILISTVAANCLCYGALAFAPDVYTAMLIRFIGGMCAGNGSVMQGYIADVTAPDERSTVMSRMGAAYNIGFIIGPALGGILVQSGQGHMGFQLPLLIASAMGGCSALGVAFFVPESRQRRVLKDEAEPSRWAMMGYAVRHPVIGRLMLLTLLVGIAFTGIESRFPLWTKDRFGWTPRDIGICFGVVGVVTSTCQFFVTGFLSKRFGEARMLAIGMGGTALAIGLQPFSDGGAMTVAFLASSALCQSIAFPNSGALMSRAIDEDHQGQIMGLNNATGALARVVGPLIAAFTTDIISHDAPFFTGALIVAPSIILAILAGRASGQLGGARPDDRTA